MHSAQRRNLSAFDARSVMLFAALTVGGSLAQAQNFPSAARSQSMAAATQPAPGKARPPDHNASRTPEPGAEQDTRQRIR